ASSAASGAGRSASRAPSPLLRRLWRPDSSLPTMCGQPRTGGSSLPPRPSGSSASRRGRCGRRSSTRSPTRRAGSTGEPPGPTGPPMTISSPPDEAGALVLEVGWPVPAGTAAVAPIEIRRLPAAVALVHVHVGPYDELPALYRELITQAHDAGYTPVSTPRER